MRHPAKVKELGTLAINNGHDPIPCPEEDTGICVEAADDVAAVVRSGKTNYWGGGPLAKQLEAEFAKLNSCVELIVVGRNCC